MRFKLDDIYSQATKDEYCSVLVSPKETSRMLYGIKIIQDKATGLISIYNTTTGGDYYTELTENEYKVFLENGWRYGVYVLSLSNYRSKLDIIEKRIHKFINDKKSEKQIRILKESRERILARYSEINFKLNQLDYGNKINNEEADNI